MKKIALLILLGIWLIAEARAATVTASLTAPMLTLDKPGSITLTWNSTGAGKCTALGDWSGVKNLSGNEVVQVTKTSVFTISCESPTGPATLKWTPPTLKTDGSPIAIKNYVIFSGPSASGLARNTTAPGDAVKTTIQDSPGVRFFSARTTGTDDIESVDSNVVSKTVVADKAESGVTVTINVRPNPPTNLQVE